MHPGPSPASAGKLWTCDIEATSPATPGPFADESHPRVEPGANRRRLAAGDPREIYPGLIGNYLCWSPF